MFARIGVIGSGPVGQSLARHASAAGFPVLIANTRGPLSLAGLVSELGSTSRAVTPRQNGMVVEQWAAEDWTAFLQINIGHLTN